MKTGKPIRRTITGTVISDRMDKTVTVEWERRERHPIYKKFVKQHTKIKAHDEKNEAVMGDVVRIIGCRPVSKDKSWRVVEIVEKAQRG